MSLGFVWWQVLKNMTPTEQATALMSMSVEQRAKALAQMSKEERAEAQVKGGGKHPGGVWLKRRADFIGLACSAGPYYGTNEQQGKVEIFC